MASGQLACSQENLTEDPAHRDLPEDSWSGRTLRQTYGNPILS